VVHARNGGRPQRHVQRNGQLSNPVVTVYIASRAMLSQWRSWSMTPWPSDRRTNQWNRSKACRPRARTRANSWLLVVSPSHGSNPLLPLPPATGAEPPEHPLQSCLMARRRSTPKAIVTKAQIPMTPSVEPCFSWLSCSRHDNGENNESGIVDWAHDGGHTRVEGLVEALHPSWYTHMYSEHLPSGACSRVTLLRKSAISA
jgi:hypothetical protein